MTAFFNKLDSRAKLELERCSTFRGYALRLDLRLDTSRGERTFTSANIEGQMQIRVIGSLGGNFNMKEKTSPYFHHMVEHINFFWKKKKGSTFGYPFRGRDFKELKNMTRNFPEWQLMALWDVFMEQDNNEYINDTGYSLNAFYACLPWLVDNPNWKYRAKEYEAKLAPIPKEISEIIKVQNES